ncbi:hypothetical protein FRB90_003784 [Tulasnella sp. 427]|nr:hypothetical protein FRB90_003784 [Tulasnella sp. 427]
MDQQIPDTAVTQDFRAPVLDYIVDSGGPEHRPLDLAYDSGVILEDHLRRFWESQVKSAEEETFDYKHPTLPLARIKKVMKSDPDVKVSRRRRAYVFIAEVTSRAWLVASAHKRRTLSRADIAKALAKSDQFDFLIDIVPRELAHEKGRSGARHRPGEGHGEDEQDIDQDHDAADDAEEADMDAGEEYEHEMHST